ncbi:hypothetical protein AA0N74_14405 [Chromobacterium vaccinii]|uniref:hypothetical protein n=1 Tax=Chromobacterium vaccinii TaxID=1108595 RepID=UPI0031D38990
MGIKTISYFESQHFGNNNSISRGINLNSYLPPLGLTDDEIILLSGAPSDHAITVSYLSSADWRKSFDGDKPRPGIYFEVTGPMIEINQKHRVGVCKTKQGGLVLYLKDIFFSDSAPKGLGGVMLKRMVRAASELNFTHIELLAAGGRLYRDVPGRPGKRYAGYYTWAKYGFDRDLSVHDLDIAQHFPHHPSGLSKCNKVQQILKLKDGHEYWKVVGDAGFMKFTLRSPSSERVLLSALKI